ncbi:MAG: nuclear transport factor 2 family protein [Thermoleophilaceae bacterium]|nr:nuclear transport factor 2 family protein [Thermoleophilaceae bacterium]
MSRANVELVQAALQSWNRSDWQSILATATPDFELDMSRAEGPFRGVYSAGQVQRFWEGFAAAWESRRFEPHEFIDAGDHVVVPVTLHMRGRDDIEVSARVTHVWTVRGGRLANMSMYQERGQALEAVGLT